MQFYNGHYVETYSNVLPDDDYGLSLSHRLLTDDRLADMRRPRLIHFYVNGDVYYKGIDLSITPNRYLNFQELLMDLEKILKPNISMPMGVRKIFTRKGRVVNSIDELYDGEAYVAAGPEPFKPLIYSSKSKVNSKSKNIMKLRSFNVEQFRNHKAAQSDNNIKLTAYRPKVITVVKNSLKGHIAIRVILNKSSLKSVEQLIESLNDNFTKLNNSENSITKLFTIGGKSIDTVEDLLRPDEVFIAMDNSGLKWRDISQIISDIFKDDYEKINIYLQRWEINQKLLSNNSAKEKINVKVNNEEKKQEMLPSEMKETKLNAKEDKQKEKETKITFQKSQSFDNVQAPKEMTKTLVFYDMPEDSSDELLIPIGKDAVSTSHMRDVMKSELRTRRHLENTRKAIIDREKARYNRLRMQYVDLSGLGMDRVQEVQSFTPIRLSRSSLSSRRYYPHYNDKHDNCDLYHNHYPIISSHRPKPSLLSPSLSTESLYSLYQSSEYDKSKVLQQRLRRPDTFQDLDKYRRLEVDNSDSNSDDTTTYVPVKNDNRVGKIPELESLRQFQEIYQILGQIGKGRFSRIFHGRSATECEREEVALKIISKVALRGRETTIDQEIDMLLRCRHEMVVNLLHQYETPKEIIMVFELAQNGDLLTILETHGPLTELQCSCLIQKLAVTLQYLQLQTVVHRNICLENVLVKQISHHNVDVLLADFSYAVKTNEPLKGLVGSPLFASPEMLKDIEYRYEVDMWSLGVLTYMILTATHPFIIGSINRSELFSNISNNQYDYPVPFWKNIMREAKELIDGLLNPKVSKRLTVIDVLCHPWILLEGSSTNLCGRDMNEIQKQRREEIEYDMRKLQNDKLESTKSTKNESVRKNEPKVVVQNPNEGKTTRSLFGFFKGMKRDESKVAIEKKKK